MPNESPSPMMHRFLSRAAGAFLAMTLAASREAQTQPAPLARPLTMAGRSPLYAPHGVAATSQPLATEAAVGVLQRGGTAVDAAVPAAAFLSVVEPMMTGIGGDLFAIVWSAKEKRLVA